MNNNSNKPQLSTNVGTILFTIFYVGLLAILVYITIMFYRYYNLFCSVNAGRKNTFLGYLLSFGTELCVEPPYKEQEEERKELDEREVFHIADQVYTYDEAKCKCESYGAELAAYEQIVDAFNGGADWCTYGWSKDGDAFYPTQKDTYIANPDGKCGAIGINGGKFAPSQRFGANCYGIKPAGEVVEPKRHELSPLDKCRATEPYDVSHILDSDKIVSFNKKLWSRYGP